MKDSTLYEVRCPNNKWKGNSNNHTCNALLGRVSTVSMGEFWCRKCKIVFKFVINEDGQVTTYDYELSDLVPKNKRETAEDRLLNLLN